MDKNPFEWKHYNLQKITFTVGGKQHPLVPYEFNWRDHEVKRGYIDLLNALGFARSNLSPNLTLEMYRTYCSVFALDLHADQSGTDNIHFLKDGSVDVDFLFSAPLPDTITACFLSYHDFCLTFKRVPEKHKVLVTKESMSALLNKQ